ncbi:MAG TPA: DEAD/DEAH box helicase [Microbacterium sp.]|nr:DEAD/DEAH box helicase [Microbacterium sp.]
MSEADAAHPQTAAFAASRPFRLDPFQVAACHALEQGSSVLVAAPTGAGKTIVGEFAIHLAMGEPSAKAFYTTPMKALSNQKFRELVDVYGADAVGLLTGDTNINGNARIVVMTTEVLRNMLYADSDALGELRYVVMDEVHYLADRFRGAVWEEVIIHLPRRVRLISLSATVSNAEEFGDWLGTVRGDTQVVVSEIRPVPLEQHVLVRGDLLPLFDDRAGAAAAQVNQELMRIRTSRAGMYENNRRVQQERSGRHAGRDARNARRGMHAPPRSSQAPRLERIDRPEVVELLQRERLLPAIFFIFSRVGCDAAVNQVRRAGLRLTTPDERSLIRQIVEERTSALDDADLDVLGYWEWLDNLQRGVASHHAGLLPVFKEVVEELFQRKLVKAVFATETLALGINMPARTVVLEKLQKFNGEARVAITPGEYTQLTGRAGRRGIDVEGHAVVQWAEGMDPQAVASLASRRTYPLNSSFRPTYNMAVNLIDQFGRGRAREILESSFAQFQADRAVVGLARQVQDAEASLQGYRDAVAKSRKASDRERWAKRTAKLEASTAKLRRQVSSRTGTVARLFDRVVDVLATLDYVRLDGDRATLTDAGRTMRRIYGERDLLVAECLRQGLWRGLDAATLVAIVCALVYEPRRDDRDGAVPKGAFARAMDATGNLWAELDDLERDNRLPGSEPPATGISLAMHSWARGMSLERVLIQADMAAGDFVRWCKQTIDLLDQLSLVAEPDIARTARQGLDAVRRGIVAYSGL